MIAVNVVTSRSAVQLRKGLSPGQDSVFQTNDEDGGPSLNQTHLAQSQTGLSTSLNWFTKQFPRPPIASTLKTDLVNSTPNPTASFLSALIHWNGSQRSVNDPFNNPSYLMKNRPTMPPCIFSAPQAAPNIKVLSGKKFAKLMQSLRETVALLQFHDSSTPTFVNSFLESPPDAPSLEHIPPEPSPDFCSLIPETCPVIDWMSWDDRAAGYAFPEEVEPLAWDGFFFLLGQWSAS
ncbi:hypothetical protein F5878DRAFT_729636 [Lentinula raphanica]|uniref:Uncharacterized protein n=1 Tax=Lentinula raphanica TaxID=153919 RepID=A0AA38U4L5_9AGAR|nr:hypothetical protein F5878DRAFT_729636 [Lentinula raphanica]